MIKSIDAETVVYRLEEAGRTLLALPGKGCMPAGFGSGWPSVVHAAMEAYGWDGEAPRPSVPSAAAITRMDEAWLWVSLIPDEKRSHRRIVLMRSLVSPTTERHHWSWRRIGNALQWDYRAVQRWHAQAIDIIVREIRSPKEKGVSMQHRINVQMAA